MAKEKGKKRESCTDVTRNDLFRSETADSDGIRIRNRKQRGVSRRARFTENLLSSLPSFFSFFLSRRRASSRGKSRMERQGGRDRRRKEEEVGSRNKKGEMGGR